MINVVVIAGPDGVGKSTLSAELRDYLGTPRLKAHLVLTRHFKVWSREPIHDQLKGDLELGDPHLEAPRGVLLSHLSVLYRSSLYSSFFFMLFLRSSLNKIPITVIIDRGWFDQLIDPKRYRLNPKSLWLVSVLGRICQPRGLLVLLTGDVNVIWKRKKEISLHEVETQIHKWHCQKPDLILDCEESPRSLAKVVIKQLVGFELASRIRKYALVPARLEMYGSSSPRTLIHKIYNPSNRLRQLLLPLSFRIPLTGLSTVARNLVIQSLSSLDQKLWLSQIDCIIQKSAGREAFVVGIQIDSVMHSYTKLSTNCGAIINEKNFLSYINETNHLSFKAPQLLSHVISDGGWCSLTTKAELQTGVVDSKLLSKIRNELEELGVVHGDLYEWNVFLSGSIPIVVDWEKSYFSGEEL